MRTQLRPPTVALYYPHLELRDSAWLRHALVLVDKFAVIQPAELHSAPSAPMRDLIEAGVAAVWIPTVNEIRGASVSTIRNIDDGAHLRLADREPFSLHRGKFTGELADSLRDNNLMAEPREEFVEIDGRAAMLLMTDLARQVGTRRGAVPITNDEGASNLYLAGARGPGDELAVIRRDLQVAVPDFGDQSLERWLAMRERHRPALDTYRKEVRRFARLLRAVPPDDVLGFIAEREDELKSRIESQRSLISKVTSEAVVVYLSLAISVGAAVTTLEPWAIGSSVATSLAALKHATTRSPSEHTFLAKLAP